MKNIYGALGLKPINTKNNKLLTKSVSKHFKCSNVYNFNSVLYLFSNCNLYKKTLNNNNQLIKVIKKKKMIHINGYIYKCIIKHKNKYLYKSIFIKEIPIINPLNLNIDFKNNTSLSYKNYILSDYINNYNSSSNVELLCCYLTSKLYELNISLHFPLFYGYNVLVLEKYTTEISEEWLNLNINIIDFSKCLIIKNNNKLYLQRENFPINLIYMENLSDDLYRYIYQSNKILEYEWSCYIFQIIASLIVIQKYFNLYHNDLHLSNIMYVPTNKKYIFYKFNDTYFRINTYNKIIKIIDWGRASYSFNRLKGNNSSFNIDGEAFGQFMNSRINNKGKKNIDYNPSMDLYILGKNLVSSKSFPKKGNLRNLINKWINNSLTYNNFNSESFSMYIKGAKEAYNAIPHKQLYDKIFKKFIINKSLIPINEKIYSL
jgi:hypothetical protein